MTDGWDSGTKETVRKIPLLSVSAIKLSIYPDITIIKFVTGVKGMPTGTLRCMFLCRQTLVLVIRSSGRSA